jgi:phosphoribosylglycinamide formyltransferase 1
MPTHPRAVVYASGSREGGGSGFQELVESTESGVLRAQIVAVVSQYPTGGVAKKAAILGVPFVHFEAGRDATERDYQKVVSDTGADFNLLSGWVLPVRGLLPGRTMNIHPALLPSPFGGKGMFGHHVHEAVMAAYRRGEVTCSGVTMHFVTDQYDQGPVFFRYPVLIRPEDTPETLAARVNKIEHAWQPWATNQVVSGAVRWDGVRGHPVTTPLGYDWHLPVGV